MLARRIADPGVLWLIDVTLENGAEVLKDEYTMVYFPGDDLFAVNRPRGLPIGNLTSQFWANVYLDDLDQFVKRRLRCPAYLRFVDDFLLFGDDKGRLWEWKGLDPGAARLASPHAPRALQHGLSGEERRPVPGIHGLSHPPAPEAAQWGGVRPAAEGLAASRRTGRDEPCPARSPRPGLGGPRGARRHLGPAPGLAV